MPQFMATADIMDIDAGTAIVLPPQLRHFGGFRQFFGPVQLVRCFEDNSRVKEILSTQGRDPVSGLQKILLVDGGGSLRCALLGDMIAQSAVKHDWAGVIINGCVRDAAVLASMDLGVMALATTPRKSVRQGAGDVDPVNFCVFDCPVQPGHFCYADEDGVVILPELVVET